MISNFKMACSLEIFEALANANFVETRQRIYPELNSEMVKMPEAYIAFDKDSDILTRSLGLGLLENVTLSGIEFIEGFFSRKGISPTHEISSAVVGNVCNLLLKRGYKVKGFSNVLYLNLNSNINFVNRCSNLIVRHLGFKENLYWVRTFTQGWKTEVLGNTDMIFKYGYTSFHAIGYESFIVEKEGISLATGNLYIKGDKALFLNGNAILNKRKQGAHLALIEARIISAINKGCNLAMVVVSPNSQAERNFEKFGFQKAYSRYKWERI